ncbi:MAG: IclR family transcriptional regulator [Haloferacaceae archaeon]
MNETRGANGTVRTTSLSLRVVDALRRLNGGRIEEVAEEVGVAPSTAYRHLNTLRQHDYVVKRGDEYRVGLLFLSIGTYARQQREHFELAQEKVDDLAEQTGERAMFTVEERGRRIHTCMATGSDAVQAGKHVGYRGYLHPAASGKAILAEYPDERVHAILDEWGLPARTENTITDRETFMAELERVREREYATNLEETTPGVRAIAVAATTRNGRVLGAFNVSGPKRRMNGEWFQEDLPNVLLAKANEFEVDIEYAD